MSKSQSSHSVTPQSLLAPPAALSRSGHPAPWSSATSRPLSDIRELSEPSFTSHAGRNSATHCTAQRNHSPTNPDQRSRGTNALAPSHNVAQRLPKTRHGRSISQDNASSSYSSTPESSSLHEKPPINVPQRSSSCTRSNGLRTAHRPRQSSVRGAPDFLLAPPTNQGFFIPNRGPSRSPVKETGLRTDGHTSEAARRVPSRTRVRHPPPLDILDYPVFKHPRVKLELQIYAPVFVGGGSVEGQVRMTVDDNDRGRHRRSMSVGAIAVDLLGFEDVFGGKQCSFLALGTELVDVQHPPPSKMVLPANALFADDQFWSLMPSCTLLPFMISLPLDTGPPPFQSKHAKIRFLLAATALVRDAGKHYRIRTSQEVHVLPTYDPEKALSSLPSPLLVSDEVVVSRSSGVETIRVTAGLHRQVWVSGNSIFVDVHISNKSRKPIKKLELTLERDILCYKHAAAATSDMSASQARVFENNEQTILSRSIYKPGCLGWSGVEPHTADTRTYELELPRGHGTVRCGKYFEVRYFLNVIASLSGSKSLSVQLPLILIHMNSLDVVPNSVAQVAAAIEEKREHHRRLKDSRKDKKGGSHIRRRSVSSPAGQAHLRRRPSYSQGRAFAAPRQQHLDRQREQQADITEIGNILDTSPRKNKCPSPGVGATIKRIANNISPNSGFSLKGDQRTTAPYAVVASPYSSTPSPPGAPPPVPLHKASSNPFQSTAAADQSSGQHSSSFGARIKKLRSAGSLRKNQSSAYPIIQPSRANARPPCTVSRTTSSRSESTRIAPHTLGLNTQNRNVSFGTPLRPMDRPGTATGLRERRHHGRFEFKAVQRKPSGSMAERGANWIGTIMKIGGNQELHRGSERETGGWI